MKTKEIIIKNFRSIEDMTVSLGERTEITGRNASGKTTIYNAFLYCLTGKLVDGSPADEVRPYGADDDVETSVTVVLDVNGEEFTIERCTSLDIVKKTGVVKGTKNRFYVNGIQKKTEKEFKLFIEELIGTEEDIIYGTIASAFVSLDNKKARAKLTSLVDFSDEEVFATNEEFESLRNQLKVGTPEDILVSLRGQANGRSRSDKGIRGRIDEIPARISELERSVSDKDFDAEKKAIQETIDNLNADASAIHAEQQKVSDANAKIMELKFQLNAIEIKAKEESMQTVRTLEREKAELETKLARLDSLVGNAKHFMKFYSDRMESDKKLVTQKKKEWKEIAAETYSGATTCPTCGQEIPKEKIQKAMESFEENKKNRQNAVAKEVNDLLARIKETEKLYGEKDLEAGQAEGEIKKLKTRLEELSMDIETLSKATKVDLSGNEDYQKVVSTIKSLEEQTKAYDQESARTKLMEINSQIQNCNRELIALDSEERTSTEAQERIAQLKNDKKYFAQELAEIERKIDLVKEFQKMKVSMITTAINGKFSLVKWQLFKQNVSNDGYTEVCEPMIAGIKYKHLNHASRMMCEFDICDSFQKISGISLPIFIDDSESLDATTKELIPSGRQVVFLKVTDENLTVKAI